MRSEDERVGVVVPAHARASLAALAEELEVLVDRLEADWDRVTPEIAEQLHDLLNRAQEICAGRR